MVKSERLDNSSDSSDDDLAQVKRLLQADLYERLDEIQQSLVETAALTREVASQIAQVSTRLDTEEASREASTAALSAAQEAQRAELTQARHEMTAQVESARIELTERATNHSINRDRLAGLLADAADKLAG